ncbi:MAG TPA: ABC transporter ATP-binding protein/permease, partial [Streptosporangiaceae bacterium]|nr:ABC transporter ATP-binding protein/permease [Streptosporangiaceae bacterium]
MTGRTRLLRTVLRTTLRHRRRDAAWLAVWSAAEALPTLVFGRAVAGAVDAFTAAAPGGTTGLGWLGALLIAALIGAVGSRRAYRHLAAIVEPLRDALIRLVVTAALRRSARYARPLETGTVARITHQAEIVRDSFAGLVTTARTAAFTAGGAMAGLLALAPAVAALVLAPLCAALALFAWSMRAFARRQREYVKVEESVAAAAGLATAALRDVVACGAEERVCADIGEQVDAQARTGHAVARIAAARSLALAVGGWFPLLLVLAAAPWLTRHGATPGDVVGALAYIGGGLQVALHTLVQGGASSGVRLAVTLEQLLGPPDAGVVGEADEAGGDSGSPGAACDPAAGGGWAGRPAPRNGAAGSAAACNGAARNGTAGTGRASYGTAGNDLRLRGVTFGYGRMAEPVIRDLDLDVPDGDHLAVVGPSGIGKSTLALLMTGVVRPLRGRILLGGTPLDALGYPALTTRRVLIPQEAYVFAGTFMANLCYLNPAASFGAVDRAAEAIGLTRLLTRLGGFGGR